FWETSVGTNILEVGPQITSLYAAEAYRLEGGPNLGAGLGSAYWEQYTLTVTDDSIGFSGGVLKYQGNTINYSSHQWTGLNALTEYFCGCDDLQLDGAPESWYASIDPTILFDSPNRIMIPGPAGEKSIKTTDSSGNG